MDADAEMTDMFQREFKKLHVDLANKEVKLFKQMFNHFLTKRLAKIEQFLLQNFEDFGTFKTTPAADRPKAPIPAKKPKIMGQVGQGKSKVKVKSEPYPDLDDEEIDLINGFHGHFLDEGEDRSSEYEGNMVNTSETPGGYHRSAEQESDNEDEDVFHNFAIQSLPPHVHNTPPRSGENGAPRCGRKRNPIWECYDTTWGDDGKVLSNDCLRCGQAVSAKAPRMRSHLMKCKEILRAASIYKRGGTLEDREKKPRTEYYRNQKQHNPPNQHNSAPVPNASTSNTNSSAGPSTTISSSSVAYPGSSTSTSGQNAIPSNSNSSNNNSSGGMPPPPNSSVHGMPPNSAAAINILNPGVMSSHHGGGMSGGQGHGGMNGPPPPPSGQMPPGHPQLMPPQHSMSMHPSAIQSSVGHVPYGNV